MQVANATARRATRASVAALTKRAMDLIAAGSGGECSHGGLVAGDDIGVYAEPAAAGDPPLAVAKLVSRDEDGQMVVRWAKLGEMIGGVPAPSAQSFQVIDVMWYEKDGDGENYFVPNENHCTKCFADCGPCASPPCQLWHYDPLPLTALRGRVHLTRESNAGESPARFVWNAPGERQAIYALIANDRKSQIETGSSAASRAR